VIDIVRVGNAIREFFYAGQHSRSLVSFVSFTGDHANEDAFAGYFAST
jgi:hypothetical protein